MIRAAYRDDSVHSHADLSLMEVRAKESLVCRCFNIRILENKHGVVASQFERYVAYPTSGNRCDSLADFGRAGKRHQFGRGMTDKVVANVSAAARNNVEQTGRNSGFVKDFRKKKRACRSVRRRL